MTLGVTQSPDSPHCVPREEDKRTSSGAGDTGESQSWSAKRRGTTLRPITKYCHNYTILYRPFHFLYPLLRLSLSFKHLQLLAIASDNSRIKKKYVRLRCKICFKSNLKLSLNALWMLLNWASVGAKHIMWRYDGQIYAVVQFYRRRDFLEITYNIKSFQIEMKDRLFRF